ncbi:hypothetical protein B0H16DRAFT_1311311, partial [Mycena metata]
VVRGLWTFGGLIIQAEKTLFRVSRDFLAFHSPVFKDMLAFPTPKDADMMDGCPFVLLPDTAEDVTVFFKALLHYDFFEPYPALTMLSILTGVLRMSHKYEVDALRKRELTHISAFHPTSLAGYQVLPAKPTGWLKELDGDFNEFPAMVVLARQLSIDWILPIVFYRMCESSWEEDLMTKHDRRMAINACRYLEGSCVSEMLAFLWPQGSVEGCIAKQDCDDSRLSSRRVAELWRQRKKDGRVRLPFEIWERDDWDRLDVCEECMSRLKADHQAAMHSLWDRLPKIFGLPEWPELRKMKDDALR